MRIIAHTPESEIAQVFLGDFGNNRIVEFVQSTQPPINRNEKWVLIVSTLFGCPVKCLMCDAGGSFEGKLSTEQLLAQIDFLVDRFYPERIVPVPKFKIQFARIGEPALNLSVIETLSIIRKRYTAKGLMPSISTIAPKGCDSFFKELAEVKNNLYSKGNFQLQFSIHTTCEKEKAKLIPAKTWSFKEINQYAAYFAKSGDRKITLNFALMKDRQFHPEKLAQNFDPNKFLVKLTPVNPTYKASENSLDSAVDPFSNNEKLVQSVREYGFETILSIGELSENNIGSNCGQYIKTHLARKKNPGNCYTEKILWEKPIMETVSKKQINQE